jgi:hypothetical protein
VWFGAWVHTGGSANYTANLYLVTAGGTARGGYRHSTAAGVAEPNSWVYMSTCVYVDPSATSITAGVAVTSVSGGATPGFTLDVIKPSLAVVGVSYAALP